MNAVAPSKSWVGRVIFGIGIFAVTMLGISWLFMSRWSAVTTVAPDEAAAAFAEARAQAGGGTPYVEISAEGSVSVHREQERDEAVELEALHMVAWEPHKNRMARIDFPYWFVRMKLNATINLGTMITALVGDWEHLDLRVSEDDLERRGPALVLDYTRTDGARVLLWTE